MANSGYADRTTLNALTPNLDVGDVADPALRLAFFQYITDLSDANWAYLQSLVTSGTLSPLPPEFVFRQAVIGGNFDVWNEGYSIDVGATGKYTAEMWRMITSGAVYTVSRQAVTDLVGSEFCARITYKSVGTNDSYFSQGLETDVFNKYKGKKATVSFKARKNGTPTIFQAWLAKTTGESNVHNGTVIGTKRDFVAAITNNWQTFKFTVDMPPTTDTDKGLQLVLQQAMTNTNEYIEIAQFQLCAFDTDLPYQPRSAQDERTLTQRFYEKSYSSHIPPATSSNTEGIECKVVSSNTIVASQVYGKTSFSVEKRISPTITVYPFATAANTNRVSNMLGVDLGANSGAPSQFGPTGFTVQNGSGGTLTTSGSAVIYHWSADARL